MRAPVKVARFVLAAIASAVFACAAFFALLALWGLAFAPFVRLESASFVVACALAGSVVSTIAAWRLVYRRYRNFFSS
jgi:uncharacterized membrane protein